MLLLLSPAKIMNFKPETLISDFTLPEYLKNAGQLIELLRNLNKDELSRLLEINTQLTDLNFDRIFNWHSPFSLKNAKQAVFVFDGEVYRGLNARTFSAVDFEYAQNHLRLLSGLYGILRPLDLIQPYRLEVSSKLKNPEGNDLYDYWQQRITKSVLKALKTSGNPEVIINLASGEYMKSLITKNSKMKVIDIEFYEYKNDNLKQIVIYTKKARGLMARFVIQNQLEDIEDLKGFSDEGYLV